jgi:hypothetical protein
LTVKHHAKFQVRIAGLRGELRTRYLPNTKRNAKSSTAIFGVTGRKIVVRMALDGDEWSDSLTRPLYPLGKNLSNHCIGGWVGLRAGPDDVV